MAIPLLLGAGAGLLGGLGLGSSGSPLIDTSQRHTSNFSDQSFNDYSKKSQKTITDNRSVIINYTIDSPNANVSTKKEDKVEQTPTLSAPVEFNPVSSQSGQSTQQDSTMKIILFGAIGVGAYMLLKGDK
jgi:hypothetical protein